MLKASLDNASDQQYQPLAPGQDGQHHTYCRLCEAVCGLVVTVRDGTIVRVAPDRAHPVSEGHLCVKGPRMVDITYDSGRVTRPLKRTGKPGEFTAVTWDEALDAIAARLRALIANHGGESIGAYMGNPASFATMHLAYAGGFLKALGGNKFFGPLHVDTAGKNLACELVYGNPFQFTFPDLEECDFLLMLGANPMVSHMSLISEPRAHRKLDAIAARGGVVVVDPRRTETAARFEHLPIRPDTDVWLLLGMLHTLFSENLVDADMLDARVQGWRELREAALRMNVEEAGSRSDIAPDAIRAVARRFAQARTGACYGRVGINRGRFTSLANVLIEALNLVTGRFGAVGGSVIGQSPFGNALAKGIEAYGVRRSRIGNLPLVMGFTPGGSLADEIVTPGEGQLRALFLDSGNPVLSFPRGDLLSQALERLELFVSLDLYITESNRYADYILPATTFFERADINDLWCSNAPRPFIHYVDAVIAPVGEARVEYEIYDALLQRLELPGIFSALGAGRPTHLQAADTLLRMGPFGDGCGARPDGLSIEMLRERHPSGLRYRERVDAAESWNMVSFPDRRPRLWGDVIAAEMERLCAQSHERKAGELRLFGRRHLKSMNSWMHNSERLLLGNVPTLLMHPEDARERGIVEGQRVRVENTLNSIDVTVEVTDDVIRGSVSYPHGWGHQGGWQRANGTQGAAVNLLASSNPADWEPVSGACLLDGVPVWVRSMTVGDAGIEPTQVQPPSLST